MKEVILLTQDDLMWPLGVQDSTPQYQFGSGSYPRTMKVDPYPAYSHDLELVEITLRHCMNVFPLTAKFGLWILSHDFIDRMNGMTYEDSIYHREDGSEWKDQINNKETNNPIEFTGQAISIALSAKRTPIMPSMTRYLVSHEYGHAVFNGIARAMGYRDSEHSKIEQKYMELRGIEDYAKKYNGGNWHRSPCEIIANDFRILFTKQEIEFYPHDCPLPAWAEKPLANWWKAAAELCGVKVK